MHFKGKIGDWLGNFLELYQTKDVTPYIHILYAHGPGISNRANTIARLPVTRVLQKQLIGEVFRGSIASKIVLVYKDMQITTLEDIQKLKVKDLREILRSNSEATGGIKADLVLKVYAILMRHVLRPGEYQQQSSDNTAQDHQNTTENSGDFKYDETLRRISALGWSTDLRQLPELNFIQLYDYLVVSTRKYRHIVLKGINYKKLKSYQFFFEGNVKRLESKTREDKKYVKASVLPSMKKSPYRVVSSELLNSE